MKLQELTGLSDVDPLHRYLGMVDKFLGETDWSDIRLPQDKLIENIWLHLGHPVQNPLVEDICLDNFEQYLKQNNEPIFVEVVNKLKRRKGQEGIDNQGIRVVMMWLIANSDLLKERYLEEGIRHRQVTSGWRVSAEE